MRWMAHRARSVSRRVRVLAVLATAAAVAFGILLLVPGNVSATADSYRLDGSTQLQTLKPSTTSESFGGVAAVGALFTMNGSKLGTHFCTASVVHSAQGDLVLTAAHCMTDVQGQVVFVPGYANGKEPYGVWPVTAVYTDQAWQSAQDPDDDVAFLRLADASGGEPIESVTGGERLGTGWREPALVQVIGYPDIADQPISCVNWAKSFSPTQLVFDCDGYTDGTSGGPFLADVSAKNGRGTVIGVIGGYEHGGNTPDVSYSPAFGSAVAALYRSAEAAG
jgi:V8-like Glu-specific endopeptidase